ncbi:LolA family protein [Virgibacillus sp. W0181]|uniref:LolA family protein n=1 Tax=Virgibacillus sp. W0181 TaxID=3391581 RepID=UPI003F45C134
MRIKTYFGILAFVGCMLLVGCTEEIKQYSPDQVINNALEETAETSAYYAEAEMLMTTGKETETMQSKEWYSGDGRMRIEITEESGGAISVNDGKSVMTYDETNNKAFVFDNPELQSFNQPSPREQAEMLLDNIRDTHQVEEAGDEEIADRDAFHLVAKAKKDNSLFGDQELWIDKDTWMVLKMITETGDSKVEMTYKEIDFNPDIKEDLFVIDLPDDVVPEKMSDINSTKEVTLEEAVKKVGKPFLYFPEKDMKIEQIEWTKIEGEFTHEEVNLEYQKEGLPLLGLSVVLPTEEPEELTDSEFELPGMEKVTVRDTKGDYMDEADLRILSWQEDGLNYSIILHDPNVTLEELTTMTSEMEFATKE